MCGSPVWGEWLVMCGSPVWGVAGHVWVSSVEMCLLYVHSLLLIYFSFCCYLINILSLPQCLFCLLLLAMFVYLFTSLLPVILQLVWTTWRPWHN